MQKQLFEAFANIKHKLYLSIHCKQNSVMVMTMVVILLNPDIKLSP
jgi:hypothetical protein